MDSSLLRIACFLVCAPVLPGKSAVRPTRLATDTRAVSMEWFQKARFGMFVHWSIASVEGLEGSWPIMLPGAMPKLGNVTDAEYRAFAKRFNPERFDPRNWIRLAQEAGQRYMIFTTKHHDGFCMFDSRYTKYKVTESPYGKDVLAQLSEACTTAGMPLGFYYSPPDLDHPGYRDTSLPASKNYLGEPHRPEWPLYLDYMELQLEELLTRYGKVPLVWFDGFKETPYSGRRFERAIERLQPHTLINNRLGIPGDFDISENVFPRRIPTKSRPIVQGTPSRVVRADISNEVPPLDEFRPWEMCVPINETWTFNPNDKKFKSRKELIQTLVEVASRGGNFLLNVGPKPDGTIQPEVEDLLRGIGAWMKLHGDSIYGTSYGPIQGDADIRTTAKDNKVFVHILNWPANEKLSIPTLPHSVKSARLMGVDAPVKFREREDGALLIDLSGQSPHPDVSVVELTLVKRWTPGATAGGGKGK